MGNYNIQITEPAEKDLHEIAVYIAKELLEPETAKKIVSKIAKAIINLEDMPFRNAIITDARLTHIGIGKTFVDNYIVFYIVTEESKTVTIIRILYTRRNWINLL